MSQIHHVGVTLPSGVAAVVLALSRNSAELREKSRILTGCCESLGTEGPVGIQKRSELGKIRQGPSVASS